ncbi:PREDICTED: cytochrome P450 78A7-like [Camelina sativa]|uniref:Cytochrome P450 78A7-like n=1 Tax=Camelina sativa TaxID=90675 RepID=A0ABM0XVK9_CAMSA|nr:PREDICTED: cytochrome P450 78A7-like [Camelina sativa]
MPLPSTSPLFLFKYFNFLFKKERKKKVLTFSYKVFAIFYNFCYYFWFVRKKRYIHKKKNMELMKLASKETSYWMIALPAVFGSQNLHDVSVLGYIFLALVSLSILTWALAGGGGGAWKNGRNRLGRVAIPGPRGIPVFGSLFTLSHGLAHRTLAAMAWNRANTEIMAFSLGSTPVIVASEPNTAREILMSPYFADRPIKQSAKSLMFSRAIGFAPNGAYWRTLRRIASTHLFAPRRILAHEAGRQLDCAEMVKAVSAEQNGAGSVVLRKHLQLASLNNIMGSVFGRRYDPLAQKDDLDELTSMVREGFELLGAFNWSDHLPWLGYFYDSIRLNQRCSDLVPRIRTLVKSIIDEHRVSTLEKKKDIGDFVDVLLSLDGDEKLQEDDMIAVLWEMIFRGTDTTALLTEWIMAELVLNPNIQTKLRDEIVTAVSDSADGDVADAVLAKLPYLNAVVKETLRLHPPGPLLSWARLSTSDVQLSNGMVIPKGTTAMVNMWAITHDQAVWSDPLKFDPERFTGIADVDIRGGDLRLAPFGAGRRVCPGKNMGLATVTRWVAELVRRFEWGQDQTEPVDLGEVLKLSCEMEHPLRAVVAEIF